MTEKLAHGPIATDLPPAPITEDQQSLEVEIVRIYVEPNPSAPDMQIFTRDEIEKVFPARDEGHVKFTPKAIADILNQLVNCGVCYKAVHGCGLSWGHFKKLCHQHPVLEELVSEAKELYREKISVAVHNRGIEGWDEPVFYMGKQVGSVRKFSDRMLEMHAKRHCPEYRDKSQVDVNVAGGVLVVQQPDVSKEEWLAAKRKRDAVDALPGSGAVE